MQKSTIGPRRMVAPQRQPSRSSSSTAEGEQRPQAVVSLSHTLAPNTLTQDTRTLASSSENASVTTCSLPGATDNLFGESLNPSDRLMALRKPATVMKMNANENVNRKVQSLVGSTTLTSHGKAPCRFHLVISGC